jgi:hypothetical protein|nr:MAG: hypothetical protein TU36_04460 [Vulcanisaeta sp. AZ3]
MSWGRDFVNQVLMEIENNILKPLEDIESSVEGIIEGITEGLNVDKPRVIATINPINECDNSQDNGNCQAIVGKYFINESIILINYKVDMNTILHLLAHHINAIEIGRTKYAQIRRLEELRLPWELRPTEITAMYRAAQLTRALSPRAWRAMSEEIRPRIRDIEERLSSDKVLVNNLDRQVRYIIESRR